VAAPPAAHGLLEGWGKAAFASTLGSCVGGHARILIVGRAAASKVGAQLESP
jgi:hypothetical protein